MKLIKKINALFLGILFSAGAVFSGILLWSSWENSEIDEMFIGGKASRYSQKTNQGQQIQGYQADDTEESVILEFASTEKIGDELEEPSVEEDLKNNVVNEKFSFVAIGDSESYSEGTGYNNELVGVMSSAREKRPDFALFTGDIISTSDEKISGNIWRIKALKKEIENYFNNYYIAFGKHDVECGNKCIDAWNDIFFDVKTSGSDERKLYFSFDYLNTHFAVLSTDYPKKHSVDEKQLEWLKMDLEKNSKPNTIVVQHVSPVSFFKESAKECHDMSCSGDVPDRLMALYRNHGVDCVISGHENAFDHKIVDGIDYVLSGNSGNKPRYKNVIKGDIYSLFIIDGKSILLQSFNTENEIIRQIKIK